MGFRSISLHLNGIARPDDALNTLVAVSNFIISLIVGQLAFLIKYAMNITSSLNPQSFLARFCTFQGANVV